MLNNKMLETSARQAGFTLIELLIAVVLGLLITAAVTAMTVGSLKMNAGTLKSARLNQDLGAVMQIMINDIRRAGYIGGATDYAVDEDINIVSSSCILYSYNRLDVDPSDPKIDDNERNGFKLDAGGIQMRTSCDPDEDNCTTSCLDTAGTWVPLTDPEIVEITGLAFNSEGSKCFNGNTLDYWVTTDVSETGFPCMAPSDDASVAFYSLNTATPPVYVAGTYTPPDIASDTGDPDDGHLTTGMKQVNVLLEGRLTVANDNNTELQTQKVLDAAIKVRNDTICRHGTSAYASAFTDQSVCVH